MNKTELIEAIAEETKVSKAQIYNILDSFIKTVSNTLSNNGKVTLVGFGTFTVADRSPRSGRNPLTGDKILLKGRKMAKFKAGKDLLSNL